MATSTVILGAGIVGCSTAYYLSQSPRTKADTIHLVEPSSELFYCASGLAGGFIAADWFAPSTAPLGVLSYMLHKKLAEQHNGRERWGYSPSTGTSLSFDTDVVAGSGEDWLRNGTSRAAAAGQQRFVSDTDESGPRWLTRTDGASLEVISRNNSTAQIDPLRFCRWLMEECLERGVKVHNPAKAISVAKDAKGNLCSIRIATADGKETDVPCTRLVIAAGSWTPKVFSGLFPDATIKIPIMPLAGYSILLRTPRWSPEHDDQGCHAVFATDTLGFSPELFSRIGGEIYIAGLNSTMVPLPDLATDVKVDQKATQQMRDVAYQMLGAPESESNDLEILREALCFRPVTSSGRPIISRVPDEKLGGGFLTLAGSEGGVYIASGHGAWGISQAPGTGLVLAEMMEGMQTSANIKALVLT